MTQVIKTRLGKSVPLYTTPFSAEHILTYILGVCFSMGLEAHRKGNAITITYRDDTQATYTAEEDIKNNPNFARNEKRTD